MVDIVTQRKANLHVELLERLGQRAPHIDSELYTAASRPIEREEKTIDVSRHDAYLTLTVLCRAKAFEQWAYGLWQADSRRSFEPIPQAVIAIVNCRRRLGSNAQWVEP
jgi:hypothetical protein